MAELSDGCYNDNWWHAADLEEPQCGCRHILALIQYITGAATSSYWQGLLEALFRFSLVPDFIQGGDGAWTEDVLSGGIGNKMVLCNCCGGGGTSSTTTT